MEPANPNDPNSASASSSSSNAPYPEMGIDDPADLHRILCIFKTLEAIIKPIKTQADIMRNRQYYLATHFHRYKFISGVAQVPKPFPTSGKPYYLRPYGYWVRDPEYDAPRPSMDCPIPFEIRDGLDPKVATENIRKLFKELDDILSKRKPTAPTDCEPEQDTAQPRFTSHDRMLYTPKDTQTPSDTPPDTPEGTQKDEEPEYNRKLLQLLKGMKM
ncbi:uncharacterized protein LOC124543242 [Vanessa cardui]|uniref:uncharacterized protein LOC124543242 n=1 Tax=Vanessa cardui TaxID=171605 RepID=UPI001F1444A7|nr:uncharacterized protein LOC124543242 [Vanessa cardui]